MNGSPTVQLLGIGIGSSPAELSNNLRTVHLGRKVEGRGLCEAVGLVEDGSGVGQLCDNFKMTHGRCNHERCGAIVARQFGVRPLLK